MIKTIFWDFDGVILDSMPIRDYGFREMVKDQPETIVNKFMKFHQYNAGLSRFVKIKYLYNQLLHQEIDHSKIRTLADKFSSIMRKELTNKKYLINDTVSFIKKNNKKYNFHVVSGSEHTELNYLCRMLDIEKYFTDINGSPTHKNDLVKNILKKEKYIPSECILIGDSINDYNAAKENNIDFYGHNNIQLIGFSKYYLENISDLSLLNI